MDKIPPTNPPISPNANNFGNFDGRNSQNNQNSKDSSKDSKSFKEFLDTMREDKKQKKEHNNGNTNNNTNQQQDKPRESQGNDSSHSYSNIGAFGGNAPMAIRGYENSGEIPQQPNSTENNPRGNREESRSSSESRESGAMGEGSQGLESGSRKLDERSEIIRRIYQRKTKLTNDELNNLHTLELQTNQQAKAYLGYIARIFYKEELNKQNLLSTIENHLKYIDNNPTNTIEIIEKINILNNKFVIFQHQYPESKHDIDKIEKKLKPLKEKYLPQKTKENIHKNKSKSNDDFGMGM